MASVWWLRWVIVALGAAIGIVLVMTQHTVLGLLILVLAGARALLLLSIRRRRAAWRQGRFGPPPRRRGP